MKALLVDDDIVSRMALVELLSAYGVFDLVEAEDGEVAWMLLEGGLTPAICFCDVRMPHMSGIDLLARMKGRPELAAIPFVLVSSASDRETVLQAVRLGAVGYILKPLHAAEARAHLENIFRITLDKLAEHPAASMARLQIGPARLLAYLAAFGQQLAAARAALGEEGGGTPVKLDALHAGCMTLGLWQGAAQLDQARQGRFDAERIGQALDNAADTVRRQASRAGSDALPGIHVGAIP